MCRQRDRLQHDFLKIITTLVPGGQKFLLASSKRFFLSFFLVDLCLLAGLAGVLFCQGTPSFAPLTLSLEFHTEDLRSIPKWNSLLDKPYASIELYILL